MIRFVAGVFLVTMPLVVNSEDELSSGEGENTIITLDQSAAILSAFKYLYNLECLVVLNTANSSYTSIRDERRQVRGLRELESRVKMQTIMLPRKWFRMWQCNVQINVLRNSDAAVKEVLSEMTSLPGFKRPLWVLLNHRAENLTDYFSGVNIPFDSLFFVVTRRGAKAIVEEVYRVKEGFPLRTDVYGVWTPGDGVELVQEPLYYRRNSLHGLAIPAVVRDHSPFTTVTRTERGIEVGGSVGIVWKHLEESMNFTTHFVVQEDRSVGRQMADGNWTGMFGRIKSGEVHVAVDSYSVNTLLRVGLGYTAELYKTTYRIYIKKPSTNQRLNWTDFLEPFSNELWRALAAAIFILSISLAICYRLGRWWKVEKSGPYMYSLYDSFHYIMGAFCQQGHDSTPESCTCRVVYITVYLTAMIVMIAYSASLIASLSNDSVYLPFSDPDGIIKDGSYEFGVENNSALHVFFLTQIGTTSMYGRLYDKVMSKDPRTYPATVADGIKTVCKRKFVFMAMETATAPILKDASCVVTPLPYKSIQIIMTFGIQPDSPYLGLINHNLLGLHESGVLRRNFDAEMPVATSSVLWTSVTLDSVTPILVVLCTSIVSSLLLLAVERWGIPFFAQLGGAFCACAKLWGTNRRRSDKTRLARKPRRGIIVQKRNSWF